MTHHAGGCDGDATQGLRRRRYGAVIAGDGWMARAEPVDGSPRLRRLVDGHVVRYRSRRVERLSAAATDVLTEWLRLADGRGYVAYSGGKDSAVVVDLLHRLTGAAEAIMIHDAEGSLADVYEAADWYRSRGVRVLERVWGSIFSEVRRTGRPAMRIHSVAMWAWRQGFRGVARGLRAEESLGREWRARAYPAIRDGGTEGDYWVCDPILHWTVDDVWAYHVIHGLAYCAVYDIDDDRPRDQRRVGSLWGWLGHETGRLARLRRYMPDEYRRMREAFPEIGRMT